MEHIELTGITVRPLLTPAEKNHEKWYELSIWGCSEFVPNEEPKMILHTIVREDWLKGMGDHFLSCIDSVKDVEFKFKKHHYIDFGGKKVEKIPSEEHLRYVG